MLKRFLCLLLVCAIAATFCACQSKGVEIAHGDYFINKNNLLADGFNNLKDRIDGVYEEDDDLTELGGQNTEPIVDFDNAVCCSMDDVEFFTRYMYYIFVEIKSSEISNALLYGINAKNDDSFWNSLGVDTDKTRREVILEKVNKFCRLATIANAVMGEYGFKESENYLLSYENLLALYGNEQAVNNHYCAYGMDEGYLKKYLKLYSAYSEFREYLVGTGGELYPTDEQAKQFFRDKCLYMNQIVFSYTYTDENNYTYFKSDKEIADARKRGEEIYDAILKDPRMYDRNMHLTEHPEWSENVHGYTYVPNDIIPQLEEAYYKLKPGEIVAVDTPLGYYILRALEKTDKAYEDSNSRIIDAYREAAFNAEMEKYANRLTVNSKEFERYSFADVLVFHS